MDKKINVVFYQTPSGNELYEARSSISDKLNRHRKLTN